MRTPTGKFLRAGLMAVLGLALVAGCTDDPKPGTVGTPTPTPVSSSASPTPSTPEAQIEAAVRAYYAELTKAAQTLDTTELAKRSTKGCPCYGVVRGIDEIRRKGKSTPDAAWTVRSIHVHDVDANSGIAKVEYEISAYDVLDSDGSVERSFPRQIERVDLSFARGSSGWIIGNLFDLKG
jgi:hypothetical protein